MGYPSLVDDTDARAAAVQIRLLREAGPTKRLGLALALSDSVVRRSRAALAERMPGASKREVALRWVELWYGAELASRVRAFLAARGPT
jgi:hypothetical protein